MKLIYIILLSLFSIAADAQIYNSIDTTWLLTYNKAVKLRDTIEVISKTIVNLKQEVNLLDSISIAKDFKITKLETIDSLHRLEIEKHDELNNLFRDKIIMGNDIINLYKTELIISEDKLQLEKSNRKKETMWKNIYKYSYPIGLIIAGILILK